jgi:predicted dehydrogenase
LHNNNSSDEISETRRKMKTLIAGYGSIGRRHLNNLKALGETDFLLLRSHHSTLNDDEIKDIPVETSINAALAHKPDGVVIANPTALHLEVAIPAAEAGCSIFMEKPVSDSTDGIDELKAALKRGGGRFLTGFQFRFNPGLQQVERWLKGGRIGEIVSAQVCWGEYLPGWHPWEDYRKSYAARPDLGGGVVNTLCHPLDYLRWLLGEVTALSATTSHKGLHLEVEDTADITLLFANGAQGSVHLDYLQRPGEHTLKLVGTEGIITWDNATTVTRYYDPTANVWEEVPPPAGFERNVMFMDETRHFIEVTQGRADPLCTLDDGLAALTLTQAVHESARGGFLVKFTR